MVRAAVLMLACAGCCPGAVRGRAASYSTVACLRRVSNAVEGGMAEGRPIDPVGMSNYGNFIKEVPAICLMHQLWEVNLQF